MDSKTKNLLIMLTVIGIITIISLIVIYKKYIKEKNTNETVRIIKYDSTGNVQSDTTQKQITVNPVLGFVDITQFWLSEYFKNKECPNS